MIFRFGPRTFAIALLLAVLSFVSASSALAGASNSLLDISTDGQLLACSNRDSGTVTLLKLPSLEKTAEIAVGKHPEGVSFLGDTHRLAVAVYAQDEVVLIDGDKREVTARIPVFDEPYGVVTNRTGTRIYVTLDFPGRVAEIDGATSKVIRELEAGPFSRGVALAADQTRLFVSEYYTGNVLSLDLASGKITDRWLGGSNDNLARQLTVHPTRPKVYQPHIRSRVTAVHGEGSIFPYVSIVDTRPLPAEDAEKVRRRRVPMDAFVGNLVTANPWDSAISPDGKLFFVVFAGTDDMFACTIIDDDYRELGYRAHLQLGRNPRGVRVAPDGQTVYVYNALDFQIVAYDTATLRVEGRADVTKSPLDPVALRGKVLFYSALQPMASRRWISCSSCHPDGEPDGRTWHNPEGLRNTQSLAGMAWTHPIHWSADRDEVQDFEHTVRGKLMQGQGLLRGKLQPELGPPNSGLSADLDALAVYSNSHAMPLSPFAKQGLSAAAERGKKLFFAEETKCATCHSGPLFTDSRPSVAEKIVRHDVGTGQDDPGEKMGPAYDTPSLIGVYRTAPYLHHGAAATLRDVLTTHNKQDRHGRTSQLSSEQVDDLVEFLKALPYEDAAAAAAAAGLIKVTK